MAEADGFNGNSIHLSLIVTLGANNAAGNYTPITWVLNAADSYGASYSGTNCTGTVTINGTPHGYSYAWNSAGAQNRVLASGSQNIPHSADGTKTMSFSFTFSGIPGTDNSAGASGSSSVTLAHIAPTAPTGFTIDVPTQPMQLVVHFTAGAGSTPSSYTVQADDDPAFGSPLTFTGTGSPMTLTGLLPGVTYTCRVRGTNSGGTGAFSATASQQTLSGGRVTHDGTAWVVPSIRKRWNGNSWADLIISRRWTGTAWVNNSN